MAAEETSILISCSLSSVGGNEMHVLSLCTLLAEKGLKATVATRSIDFVKCYHNDLKNMGIAAVSTPFRYSSPQILKNLWAALFWFRLPPHRRFTHLIAIGPGGFHQLLKRCLLQDGITMYWEAGDGLRCKTRSHMRMLHSMDKVAATSRPVAERMERELNRTVGVLPPLTIVKGGRVIPSKVKKSQSEIRISFLGRVSRLKGVDVLLNIWADLEIGQARLDLYGGGEELSDMIQMARRRGLLDSVHFHGPFDHFKDLPTIMAESDMVVLPSLTEGLPHVLIESMAYGVPFVATNVGGIRDLARGNPDVLVVEPTLAGIARGIKEMVTRIRNGDVSCERLIAYYRKYYATEIVGEQWLNFLGLSTRTMQRK